MASTKAEPARIPIGQATKILSRLVRCRETVVLTRSGDDVALLVPMPDDAAVRRYRISLIDEDARGQTWEVRPEDRAGV